MKGSLNVVALCGEVIKTDTQMVGTYLCTKVRLAIASDIKKKPTNYIDVYAFKDLGKQMLMTCEVGTIVYVEGRIANASKRARVIIPFILATNIQCLLRPKKSKEPTGDMIALLDEIDPLEFYAKKKRKKPERDADDDEG